MGRYHFKEEKIKKAFEKKYHAFKYFFDDEFTALRILCIEAVQDDELLSHIIFCNDIFHIPPVRTFLTVYKNEVESALGTKKLNSKGDKQKRALGAFWGTVFKYLLKYPESKNVTVPLKEEFGISTASYYIL